ncbi:class I SAM-dependent methyltransferase [Amycolatopsis sp. NPDC059657]|uniref:class I SAM-dependent methyltransferase n=1 Tax=Amycolatopsis sp. NPDC059657 TaxID=3346899 RepID=UPI00366E2F5D
MPGSAMIGRLGGMGKVRIFAGDTVDNYAKHRRGYRPDVIGHLAAAFGVGAGSRVLDLGCGTGQLAYPFAEVAGAVIGMDPSVDMLAQARAGSTASNITWLLGADTDVPTLETLLGKESLDLATIGSALHWMEPAPLFAALARLLRPGGGVAVTANGIPMWTHDTPWSHALAEVSAEYLGKPDLSGCGTDDTARAGYAEALRAAGFTDVKEERFDYTEAHTPDDVIGSLYSAANLDALTDEQRADFDAALRAALGGGPFVEDVPVKVLTGRCATSG